ncbi:hypothetical protein EGN72_00140, partial [Pseudorhodobacter sp. E13]|uniref:hypothetical protein n=1 Tax=Pseudorhodobacter sp. E13 TaxID=2487931 RepID=UPI000F99032A
TMKRYEIKSGLNAGLDGVRTDKRSALGQALGYADIKWRLLLDPDYSPNGVPFDRVNGRLTAASVPIPRGNFANGAAAFNLISNTQVQP